MLAVLLLFSCRDEAADKKAVVQVAYHSANDVSQDAERNRLNGFAGDAERWCASHHYNTHLVFLADMARPSGRNRFFVYDMQGDSVVCSSLVTHGCCNCSFLQTAKFSNENGCGCSSFGKYKVGGKYKGNYGTAYRLTGLDSSNSKASERNLVLHSYYSVPDTETYPDPIVNSYGCPMVSERFLKVLEKKIDASERPVLLWILN